MRLKFIGKNGSMGLHKGSVYDGYFVQSRDGWIWLKIELPKPLNPLLCPYKSLKTLLLNWEEI